MKIILTLCLTIWVFSYPGECKIYSRCELARELIYRYRIPRKEAGIWVCIADQESTLNTAAMGRKSGGSQYDHGLFQFSDRWWCGRPGQIACKRLRDDNIKDDLQLARKVKSSRGWNAWSTSNKCLSNYMQYLSGCL